MRLERGWVWWTVPLIALAVAGAAFAAVRSRSIAPAEAAHQSTDQAVAQYGLAFRDLNRLMPPTGMFDCNGALGAKPSILRCWRTSANAKTASPVVAHLLTTVGATRVHTHCRTFGPTGRQLTQCHTDAQLDGHPLGALVMDGVSTPTQVMISLDTGLVAAPAIH